MAEMLGTGGRGGGGKEEVSRRLFPRQERGLLTHGSGKGEPDVCSAGREGQQQDWSAAFLSRQVRGGHDLQRVRNWAAEDAQLMSLPLNKTSGGRTSVISRSPSHSLDICQLLDRHVMGFASGSTDKIVVAVPTKNRLAFSPPACDG